MQTRKRLGLLSIIGLIPVLAILGCASLCLGDSEATIAAQPNQVVLSPALIKQPIVITGAGWKPGEIVVVNLLPLPGVEIKGVEAGEPVGIANGTANDKGILETNIGAISILMTFFQVGWDNNKMKPDFKQARPLPPGTYTLDAIGTESERRTQTTLTLVPPPKKK